MSEIKKDAVRNEVEKEIIRKATEDQDFKESLKEKPHEALLQLGIEVPREVELKIIEESVSDKVNYLVLPANPYEIRATPDCSQKCSMCELPYQWRRR